MISLKEWKAMSGKEQALHLENNAALSKRAESLRGLVRGVGINDATYCTQPRIDGVKVMCPAYRAWKNMLTRAYSPKYHAKHPTYSGVTVCDDWHLFMSFREWWLDNQADGFALDKDILSDDGVYSPDACLLVPQLLNNFITDCGATRGEWPIGVISHKKSGRFMSRCCNPKTGRLENLGYFNTPEEAHLAWKARKLELADELKPRMDSIDQRIYPRVVEIISNAK
jgi:hypothetical protein